MTPRQILAVQQSWWPLHSHIPAIAAIFELNLTAKYRAYEFRVDSPDNKLGLLVVQTLHDCVTLLEDPDRAVPLINRLGAALADGGVVPAHYPALSDALLLTLSEVIGPRFDAELAEAWAITCDTLAGALQIGASRHCAA